VAAVCSTGGSEEDGNSGGSCLLEIMVERISAGTGIEQMSTHPFANYVLQDIIQYAPSSCIDTLQTRIKAAVGGTSTYICHTHARASKLLSRAIIHAAL
jgi:hypothetical protein